MQSVQRAVESERARKREKKKSQARERIMNRLFISFSSVKLLRMARPRGPRFLFHRHVMYIAGIARGDTSCFLVVIIRVLRL